MDKQLEQLREALFPKIEMPKNVAADPVAVAWKFNGVPWSHPNHGHMFWWGRSSGAKLLLVTVATLQAEGLFATPRTVWERMGLLALSTVRRNLKWMACLDDTWAARNDWTPQFIPLIRRRHGRTYQYFIPEPPTWMPG